MRGHFVSFNSSHAPGPVCVGTRYRVSGADRPRRAVNHLQTSQSIVHVQPSALCRQRSDAASQLSANWTSFAMDCPGPGFHFGAWSSFTSPISRGPAWCAVELRTPDEQIPLRVQMTHGHVRNEPHRYPQATASVSPVLKQLRSLHDRQTFHPQGMRMVRLSLRNDLFMTGRPFTPNDEKGPLAHPPQHRATNVREWPTCSVRKGPLFGLRGSVLVVISRTSAAESSSAFSEQPRTTECGQRERSVRRHRINRSLTVAAPFRNIFRAAASTARRRP